jgi:ribosomal protein L24E
MTGEHDRCAWCGADVELGDGFRAYEMDGGRRAVFCRLEHIVAWAIRGAWWEPLEDIEHAHADDLVHDCAHCGAPLVPGHVLLVRARGVHRVPDGFCTVGHLLEWAKAGGRYAAP